LHLMSVFRKLDRSVDLTERVFTKDQPRVWDIRNCVSHRIKHLQVWLCRNTADDQDCTFIRVNLLSVLNGDLCVPRRTGCEHRVRLITAQQKKLASERTHCEYSIWMRNGNIIRRSVELQAGIDEQECFFRTITGVLNGTVQRDRMARLYPSIVRPSMRIVLQ